MVAEPTTLTYWFSDLESSTRLWEEHPEAMHDALARHDAILRAAVEKADGSVVKTTGDGLMGVFDSAGAAVAAGIDAQRKLNDVDWGATGPLMVRIGIHSGEAQPRAGDFYGPAVNRAARIMAAAHGGQVLVSSTIADSTAGSLPSEASFRDLGEHRLKDLAGPEHLYQLVLPGLPDAFPPLATLDTRPNNLPTQSSIFLGRDAELDELRRLIDSDSVRLLTLVGPGGTGKTRLALQAAADQIDRFEDGLFLVDLAAEREPDGAFSVIVRTVGLDPMGEAPPLDALKRGLRERRMLLLLDNFEQVSEAALGVADVLESSAGLQVIVTSREALRVRGERRFPVPPLSLPPTGNGEAPPVTAVLESEAVQLFVERAIEIKPDFAVTDDNVAAIADITVRLDGLPLAIELAAARLRLFTPEDLRERLESRLELLRGGARDLPGRQQTLRGTIEWSHELLSDGEQQLFRIFGVFSGAGFEDIEAVTARIDLGIDVIDSLESLVDKSLIRAVEEEPGRTRFAMLETIGEYARERLSDDGDLEAAVRRAHAEHYLELAVSLRPDLTGPDREAALARLQIELGNLQEAWHYWVELEDLERLYDFLDPLWALYDAIGWYNGVIELSNDLLALIAGAEQSADRVREEIVLQMSLARALMTMRGYSAEVEEAYARALDLAADAGERRFPVLRSLAGLYALRNEGDKAGPIGWELLAIAEEQDDPSMKMHANLVVGSGLMFTGHTEEGVEHLDAAIELFDPSQARAERFAVGPNPGVTAMSTSALLLWMLGFPERAIARAEMADRASAELGHPFTRAYALYHVAFFNLGRQEMGLVAEGSAELLAVANQHNFPLWRALATVLQGVTRIASGEADEGFARLEQGILEYKGQTTPPTFWPLVLIMRAGACAMGGRIEDGLELVDEALGYIDSDNALWVEPAILKADLLLARAGPSIDQARALYEDAHRVGVEFGMRMGQLRAATRLAALEQGTEREAGAKQALADVYRTFTEGFDAPDLVAARAILDGA